MNRKRVQELRDMFAGIPATRVMLERVFSRDKYSSGIGVKNGIIPTPKPCTAVACLAGWAWIYPPFVEAGIREADRFNDSVTAKCAAFFGVSQDVFGTRGWCAPDEKSVSAGTDKQVALRRLDRLLRVR